MIQFTKDCEIGVPQIDKEHAYLFELINSAYTMLDAKAGERTALLKNILMKLQNYAKEHFAHEEEYMTVISDPELPMQRTEHELFVNKVGEFVKEVSEHEAVEEAKFREVLEFLTRWLYHHILSSDMMIGKSIIATKENPFAFTQNFHTGIVVIDEEHQKLFAIIEKTNATIHAEFLHDKYDEIMGILSELRAYTEKHFRHEEEYMASIGYPGLQAQKNAHEAFIEKLVQIDLAELEELDDNQQEYLESLIEFLAGWLVMHILNMDKKIADYAATGK